jgi:hypothetical protein
MTRGEDGDIERQTREGLAEGYRLASEAREAIRSRYKICMLVILIFALILLVALQFLILLSGALAAGPGLGVASNAAVAAVCIPLLLVCRNWFRGRMAEQDRWMARLSGQAALGDGVSRFDLLVEVSRQVPVWLSIRDNDQMNRFRRHPFLTIAMFISAIAVGHLAGQAVLHFLRGDSPFICLALMLAPFLALLIGTLLAERSAVRRERDAILARWNERVESSRRTMEEILGGL